MEVGSRGEGDASEPMTYTVRIDNQLNNVFGISMQNLHSGSRYQGCKILQKHKTKQNVRPFCLLCGLVLCHLDTG